MRFNVLFGDKTFTEQIEKTAPRLLAAILVFIAGWFLIKLLMKLMGKAIGKTHIEKTLHAFILSVTRMILIILLALVSLGVASVPISPLITALGAAGLALSLAIKDGLTDLAGGVFLLASKRFAVGDYIEVNGIHATVHRIDLVNTVLKGFDNKMIFIPNSQMSAAQVINYSAEPLRRLDNLFSIRYEDDFELAKKLIRQVIDASPLPLREPEPVVRVSAHTPRGVDITSRVWVKREDYFILNFYMLEEVKKAFDSAGIVIPHLPPELNVRP